MKAAKKPWPARVKAHGQTGPKLNKTRSQARIRIEIVRMLAMGLAPSVICQELKEQYGITMSRENIRSTYQMRHKWKHLTNLMREHMAAEVMKHPLANKRVRLNYLLRGLNHALKWSTDKLYFDKDGNLVGKLDKVQLGAVAALIKESREEIEGVKQESPDVRVNLVTIIKDVVSAGGVKVETSVDKGTNDRTVDPGRKAGVDPALALVPDRLDTQGSGDYHIL